MGEVEWSASSSETNPMLGIGRQSKRQSIGIMWGLSRPTLAWGGEVGGRASMVVVAAFGLALIHAHAGRLAVATASADSAHALRWSVGQKAGDGAEGGRASCSLYLALITRPIHQHPPSPVRP